MDLVSYDVGFKEQYFKFEADRSSNNRDIVLLHKALTRN